MQLLNLEKMSKMLFTQSRSYTLILLFCSFSCVAVAHTYSYVSDGYLKAVEMDWGDTLVYELKSGQMRTFVLQKTAAEPAYIYDLPENQWRSGCIYRMQATLLCEGQPLTLHRIVSAQQSYYEPYHINGVTIFFDAVNDIEDFIKDNHGSSGSRSFPRKKCRLAFIEMGGPFAPQELRPWFPIQKDFLDVQDSYEGADTWLGGFKKGEAHNGLDVNVPNNTPLWAPIDFDNQYYFNSLAQGDNNNRWKGIRNWENGEQWILRTHHMTELHVQERTPVPQGRQYGEVGGVHYGSHPHVHFFFQWNKEDLQLPLDPWIIFWKIFENNRARTGAIKADMQPFQSAKRGERVVFDARSSRAGERGSDKLRYFWSVSDGGFYEGPYVSHAFTQAGVHAVTLLVTDGADTSSLTQQISVLPSEEDVPYLRLFSDNLQDFRRRLPSDVEMYGLPKPVYGNYLHFYFRKNEALNIAPKTVQLEAPEAVLEELELSVEYLDLNNWLDISHEGNTLQVSLKTEALHKAEGTYQARVRLFAPLHQLEQVFYVHATAPHHRDMPPPRQVIDDRAVQFFPSPFAWVENPYEWDFLKGHGSYRMWAGTAVQGFARYQPDLQAGRYLISLHPDAHPTLPYSEEATEMLRVRIMTIEGLQELDWHPSESRTIGEFHLAGGQESFLDICTKGSQGLVFADALIFEKTDD